MVSMPRITCWDFSSYVPPLGLYLWIYHSETKLKHTQTFGPHHTVFYNGRVAGHITWKSHDRSWSRMFVCFLAGGRDLWSSLRAGDLQEIPCPQLEPGDPPTHHTLKKPYDMVEMSVYVSTLCLSDQFIYNTFWIQKPITYMLLPLWLCWCTEFIFYFT